MKERTNKTYGMEILFKCESAWMQYIIHIVHKVYVKQKKGRIVQILLSLKKDNISSTEGFYTVRFT